MTALIVQAKAGGATVLFLTAQAQTKTAKVARLQSLYQRAAHGKRSEKRRLNFAYGVALRTGPVCLLRGDDLKIHRGLGRNGGEYPGQACEGLRA